MIASVCTGSLLLAAAGVLNGRPAATHHSAHKDLCEMSVDVLTDRLVDDGPVLTASGITSGFDLVARECGEDVADNVARQLEYERVF